MARNKRQRGRRKGSTQDSRTQAAPVDPVGDESSVVDAVQDRRGTHGPRRVRGAALPEWQGPLDLGRVLIFILFAFGISWAVAAYIYWTGGLTDRPPDDLLFGLPRVLILIAVVYMGAPTFANLLTRMVTREVWGDLWITPHLRRAWPYWLIAWVLPGVLTVVGGAVFFGVFPQHFDSEFAGLQSMLEAAGPEVEAPEFSPPVMILLGTIQGILIAPLVNGPATFGEEFGWRGYLLQKLMPLGWRRACIWMGVIWGVWHWPIIAMGHNYGLEYPGAPWAGMLLFVWFTFSVGTILGWLTLRGRSVWPAVIGHAAVNGIAALGTLLTVGEPNPLLGPLPVGFVGMIGFSVVALWMFFRKP